tara:strand:- start:990 stop:1220 length:231 start_codon:yes stop_codon:yes gene_type:complete
MLSEFQIKRVLEQCKRARDKYENMDMVGDEGQDYFNYMRTKGWIDALKFVLHTDVESINNKPLNKENQEDEEISTR